MEMGRPVFPVILSGGSGTRLWPLSRKAFPKQFLPLVGEASLFRQACERLHAPDFAAPLVLTSNDHRFIVAEQMREIGCRPTAIVLEPVGRNTAPAALVAALMAARQAPDALVLLAPSDHFITDRERFLESVRTGIPAAREGRLVTFGVKPDGPHTGYGYIEVEPAPKPLDVLEVRRFVEKPPREQAEQYVRAGNYFWNAGIFLFSAGPMIEAFEQYHPSLVAPCREALEKAREDLDFLRLDEAAYARCEDISLDHAIMERADNICCVPLRSDWSDLGSWQAVTEHHEADAEGNAAQGEALFQNSRNCFVYSADDAFIVVNGLEDVIVTATRDVVLVTSKTAAGQVGEIARSLKRADHPSATHHVRVYRPWGWFEGLAKGQRFQVKCLMVKPGEKLSLQSHRFRAEHWVVVQGMVRVTVREETKEMSVDESVYIPIGAKHRLENPFDTPALLIEVQTGDYLEEDDIIRYDDAYNRG